MRREDRLCPMLGSAPKALFLAGSDAKLFGGEQGGCEREKAAPELTHKEIMRDA